MCTLRQVAALIVACHGLCLADDGLVQWTAKLSVLPVEAAIVGGRVHTSSTQLVVAWTPPPGRTSEYLVHATGFPGGHRVSSRASGDSRRVLLEGLASATTYQVRIEAVRGGRIVPGDRPARGRTAAEVWQLQGEGATYEGVDRVVDRSNVLSQPIRYGFEAGAALAGRVRLFHNPRLGAGGERWAIAAATTSGPASADPSSVAAFVSEDLWPLQQPESGAYPRIREIRAFQPIPMIAGRTRFLRFLFEASGQDGKTRLFQLDSTDGLGGLHLDLSRATLAIGVEGDRIVGDSGMLHVRQSKLAWPTQEDWMWNGSQECFLVATGADAAGQTDDGLFLAQWDGRRWSVARDGLGRARPLVLNAHGPVPCHLGGGRYKVYYEDASQGHQEKPFRVLYADLSRSGDPSLAEPADFESEDQARQVEFLWPDGSTLDASKESGLGDHAILLPTSDLDVQVLYVNLGGFDDSQDPGPSGGVGMAILVNP